MSSLESENWTSPRRDIAAMHNIWFDLILLTTIHCIESQVLSEAVQGTENSSRENERVESSLRSGGNIGL